MEVLSQIALKGELIFTTGFVPENWDVEPGQNTLNCAGNPSFWMILAYCSLNGNIGVNTRKTSWGTSQEMKTSFTIFKMSKNLSHLSCSKLRLLLTLSTSANLNPTIPRLRPDDEPEHMNSLHLRLSKSRNLLLTILLIYKVSEICVHIIRTIFPEAKIRAVVLGSLILIMTAAKRCLHRASTYHLISLK